MGYKNLIDLFFKWDAAIGCHILPRPVNNSGVAVAIRLVQVHAEDGRSRIVFSREAKLGLRVGHHLERGEGRHDGVRPVDELELGVLIPHGRQEERVIGSRR